MRFDVKNLEELKEAAKLCDEDDRIAITAESIEGTLLTLVFRVRNSMILVHYESAKK